MHNLNTKKVNIREFRKEDLFSVATIEGLVFGDLGYAPLSFLDFDKELDVFFVAVLEEKIFGYILASKISRKQGKVVSVAVHPNYQSQGVGMLLMRSVIKRYSKEEVNCLMLEVRRSNVRAIKFYKKMGFEKIERLSNYYDDGEDAFLMEKSI